MTPDEQVRRYQRAAEMTLEQLDWCISYLRAIRKKELARALSRNSDDIRQRLRKLGHRP